MTLSTAMMVRMNKTAPSYRDSPPRLIAGALSLDFVNTVEWRSDPARRMERLVDYGELLLWSLAAGLLDEAGGRRRLAEAEARPAVAAGVVEQAIAARETLVTLLEGAADSRALSDFDTLLRRIPAGAALAVQGHGYAWRYDGGDRLADPLWPVLWDAAALLTSANLQRLGRCDDEHCGWFFLDHSRNRSRRWCAMEDCGNRAKARRHYARLKTSGKG